MITVLSPAKSLDFDSPTPDEVLSLATMPRFIAESSQLMDVLRAFDAPSLGALMSISDKLACLNVARNAQWSTEFTADNAKPAILAFDGDVYDGLNASNFGMDDLAFAQQHVRVLSGLYGVLRPLDWMQPYRLEMGTALSNPKGAHLYAYWGATLARSLGEELRDHGHALLINLASQEYFKAVQIAALGLPVIEPVFRDQKNGVYKVISFFAKRARGTMARYIVDQRIDQPDALKGFDWDGYYFVGTQPAKNGVEQWLFHRDEPIKRA